MKKEDEIRYKRLLVSLVVFQEVGSNDQNVNRAREIVALMRTFSETEFGEPLLDYNEAVKKVGNFHLGWKTLGRD